MTLEIVTNVPGFIKVYRCNKLLFEIEIGGLDVEEDDSNMISVGKFAIYPSFIGMVKCGTRLTPNNLRDCTVVIGKKFIEEGMDVEKIKMK